MTPFAECRAITVVQLTGNVFKLFGMRTKGLARRRVKVGLNSEGSAF